MVVKSYEQMTDVSIMEVKTYLLIHSDGIYQQDIYDLMNTCIDVFQLKRKLNKRKDIQLWLFQILKDILIVAYLIMKWNIISHDEFINQSIF